MDEIQQQKPEPLPLRQNIPRDGVRLKKSAVIGGIAFIAAIVGISLLCGLSSNKDVKAAPNGKQSTGSVADNVQDLPRSYSELARAKLNVKSILPPQQEKTTPSESEEEKLFREFRIRQLKQALKAREGELAFSSLKVEGGTKRFPSNAARESDVEGGPAPASFNQRDDENRQDEKEKFLRERKGEDTILSHTVQPLASRYTLLAGTVIPGLLLTGINSDLPGEILGQVSKNLFDSATGKYLLIPKGAKLVGSYDSKITYGQERVLIVWNRILFPSGESIFLEGMPGVDGGGVAGLHDQVNNHYGKLFTGVILGSLLGAGAQVARGSNQSVDPEYSQLALEGAAQNVNQAGQKITQKNLGIQPTLEIRAGSKFNAFLTRDVVVEH